LQALAETADVPFRVPPGARLVPINPRSGERMAFGSSGSILEPFKPGTEPGRRSYAAPDGGFRVPGASDFGGRGTSAASMVAAPAVPPSAIVANDTEDAAPAAPGAGAAL